MKEGSLLECTGPDRHAFTAWLCANDWVAAVGAVVSATCMCTRQPAAHVGRPLAHGPGQVRAAASSASRLPPPPATSRGMACSARNMRLAVVACPLMSRAVCNKCADNNASVASSRPHAKTCARVASWFKSAGMQGDSKSKGGGRNLKKRTSAAQHACVVGGARAALANQGAQLSSSVIIPKPQ